jgi:hypothetical protein
MSLKTNFSRIRSLMKSVIVPNKMAGTNIIAEKAVQICLTGVLDVITTGVRVNLENAVASTEETEKVGGTVDLEMVSREKIDIAEVMDWTRGRKTIQKDNILANVVGKKAQIFRIEKIEKRVVNFKRNDVGEGNQDRLKRIQNDLIFPSN